MAARPKEPPELTELLLTAVVLGCLGGGVVGAVAGGLAGPPLGIGFGAVAGVYVGALLGVVNALAMWALGRWAHVPPAAGTAGRLVSGGSTALAFLAGDSRWYRGPGGRRILRITARTAMAAAAVGGGVGLVIGLRVNAPTAPFAVIEVGLPAAALGLLLGAALGVGRVAVAGRRR